VQIKILFDFGKLLFQYFSFSIYFIYWSEIIKWKFEFTWLFFTIFHACVDHKPWLYLVVPARLIDSKSLRLFFALNFTYQRLQLPEVDKLGRLCNNTGHKVLILQMNEYIELENMLFSHNNMYLCVCVCLLFGSLKWFHLSCGLGGRHHTPTQNKIL
jgi:hypothetical protein